MGDKFEYGDHNVVRWHDLDVPIRFQLDAETLFTISSLNAFFALMEDANYLRDAVRAIHYEAIRGTSYVEPHIATARRQMGEAAKAFLIKQLNEKFNAAIMSLEEFVVANLPAETP